MKKIVRNVFALLLALTFILSLAACGGNSASSGAAPAASGSEETSTVASTPETKDPVTLTVYTWWDVTKFEHLQKMKSDFEAENPDIKLEFVTIPSKYADTMITKLAAGEIPDVMMLAMDQVPRYALNGMLMPLDDLASQDTRIPSIPSLPRL